MIQTYDVCEPLMFEERFFSVVKTKGNKLRIYIDEQ
jgi:hypothetical protein